MSDALSKTVPIWCAVWNRCFFGEREGEQVWFPKECVSAQEMSYIEALIPSFVIALRVPTPSPSQCAEIRIVGLILMSCLSRSQNLYNQSLSRQSQI
jgi:hypothetical protein